MEQKHIFSCDLEMASALPKNHNCIREPTSNSRYIQSEDEMHLITYVFS